MKNLINNLILSMLIVCVSSCSQDALDLCGDTLTDSSMLESNERILIDEAYWANYYDSIKSPDNWKKYRSFEEKLEACQIDARIVEKLSTQTLIKLLLERPLMSTFIAYDNQFTGLEIISKDNNIFKEAIRRPDAAEIILKEYENSLNFFSNLSYESECHKLIKSIVPLAYFELLIAHGDFKDLYKEEHIFKLSQLVNQFLELKRSHPDVFDYESLRHTLLIKASIMINREEASEAVLQYYREGEPSYLIETLGG